MVIHCLAKELARDSLSLRIVESVPCVGAITTATIYCELLLLGKVTRNKLTKLVGVAPLTKQSGDQEGTNRSIRKGAQAVILVPAIGAKPFHSTHNLSQCSATLQAGVDCYSLAEEAPLKIQQLKLRVSNAYLILADKPILLDTGSPGESETIRSRLRKHNVEFADLSLIVHTHVHSDHMGNTAMIATEARCPIAYHHADQPIVARSNNGRLTGIGLRGQIMSRFFSNAEFDSVNADIDLQGSTSLKNYGADVAVIQTPGHTPGSISIVTSDGDAIIGDVIMGGYMGGNVLPKKPNYHYFADNIAQAMSSLDLVLSRTNRSLYVGHGGPLGHASVHRWRMRCQRATGMSKHSNDKPHPNCP